MDNKFTKIEPEELKQGDWFVSIDHNYSQDIAKVDCVDNNVIWSKGLTDSTPIKESYQELRNGYKEIYRIN